MKKALGILTFLGLNLITMFSVFAQQFPATAVVTLGTPKPLYLSEYYAPGASALTATLVLSDFSVPSFNTKIRITIEGNNLKIRTKDSFLPVSPINLTPGVPTVLSGTDLQPYLAYENVDLLSGDPNAFIASGGKLPEGFYKFCVEVLDYRSGMAISREACAMANIFREQPPRPLQPLIGKMVQPMTPQNILLSWQVAPGGSPILAASSQYVLEMYQVIDVNANPLNAVVNGQAQIVFTSASLLQTTLNLDLTTSQLQAGYKYVWRVRALDDQGRDVYANNGYSEWAWFYYGYPTGGSIALSNPTKGVTIKKNDPKQFNWGASSEKVQGQQFVYKLTIVEVNDGQTPEEAMTNNPNWHTENLPSTYSTNGASFELTKGLEFQKQYAWQVKAYTEEQEIAASEVWDFYGPPVVEEFFAGNFKITVRKTDNTDIKDLDGVGYVQLSSDPSDTVTCNFEGIALKEISAIMFLDDGDIFFDLSDRPDLEIKPQVEANGTANFVFDQGKIDELGLYYLGYLHWPFPHAITAPTPGFIDSKPTWFVVDEEYKIAGTARFKPVATEFELLNPYKHIIRFDTISDFRVAKDKFELRTIGEFQLHESIPTNDGKPYIMPFDQQNNVGLITAKFLLTNATNHFKPLETSSFAIKPYEAIIDLTEVQSPGILSSDKAWKGVYFPKFRAVFPNGFDASNQFTSQYDIEVEAEVNANTKLWTTSQGMFIDWEFEIEKEADDLLAFNQFRCNILGKILMEAGSISESSFNGEFYIPFIDENEVFTYTAPLTNEGIQTGVMNQDLAGRNLSYNPYGGENRMDIEILRAVFADNERLDLVINADMPAFDGASYENLDFRIYGDNFIGFGQRNGSVTVNNPIYTKYAGYDITIEEIGASFDNGRYSMAILGNADYGDRIVGENGPPKFGISSVRLLSEEFHPGAAPNVGVPPISVQTGDEEKKKFTAKSFIKIENTLLDFTGWVNLVQDDPAWGKCFTGVIEGALKYPTRLPMQANILVGNLDGTDFWYFDAYFQDSEGSGVPIVPPFSMVGMESRAYYHMNNVNGAFVVDKNVDMGMAGYLQLIDTKTSGRFMATDMSMELELTGSDLTALLKGDVSLLNQKARKDFTKEIAMAAASEIVKAIDLDLELDVTVPITSSDEVGIRVSTKNGNSFRYANSSEGIDAAFETTTAGSPGVGVGFGYKGNTIRFDGNAEGEISTTLDIGDNSLSAGYNGTSVGYFNAVSSGITLNTDFDADQKNASANLTYGNNAFALTANNSQALIEGRITYNGNNQIYGGYKVGKGLVGFDDGSTKLEIQADPATRTGVLTFNSGTVKSTANAYLDEMKGDFTLKTSTIDFFAESNVLYQGSALFKESGGKELELEFDKINKSHFVKYTHDPSKSFSARLQNAEYARLAMEIDGTKFGVGGTLNADSGSVLYSDGSMLIDLKAQPINKSGDLHFNYNGEYDVLAAVSQDSGFASYSDPNVKLAVSGYASGSGRLHAEYDQYNLTMYGDQINKYGTLSLNDNQRSIYIAGCKNGLPAKYAKQAGLPGEFGQVEYKDSQYDFGGYFAPGDSLRARVVINGSGYEVQANSLYDYKLFLVDPSAQLDIIGNLPARELAINYSESGLTLSSNADFSAEEGAFNLASGGDTYAYEGDDDKGTFTATTSSGNWSTERDGDEFLTKITTPTGSFDLTVDQDDFSPDLTWTNGSLTFTISDGEDLLVSDGTNTYGVAESMLGTPEIVSNGSAQSGNSANFTLGQAQVAVTLNGTDRSLTYTEGSTSVVMTANGTQANIVSGDFNLTSTTSQVELTHADKTFTLNSEKQTTTFSNGKTLEIAEAVANLSFGDLAIELNVEDKLSVNQTQKNMVAWMDETRGFGIEKQDQKAIVDLENQILVQADATKYVKLEGTELTLNIDQVNLFVDPTSKLVYDDTENYFEISPEKFGVALDQMEIGIGLDGYKLQIDPQNYINFGLDNMAINIAGIGAEFNPQIPLNFTSDLGSFSLGVDGLDLSYEDISLGFGSIDGIPTLSFENPLGSLKMGGLSFDLDLDAGFSVGMNPENWLDISAFGTDFNFGAETFNIFNTDLDLGFSLGGDYLASFKNPIADIDIPKVGGLSLSLPDVGIPFDVSLNPDLSFDMDFGDIDMSFFTPDYALDLDLGVVGFSVPKIPNGFGFNADLGGFNAGFQTIKNELSKITLGTPSLGDVSFGINADEAITIGHSNGSCSFEVTASLDGISGKKSGDCSSISIPEPLALILVNEAQPAKPLETAAEIPAGDGAQYLEGSVAEDADGFARGTGEVFIDTKNNYIGINAGMVSNQLVCLNGSMAFVSDDGDWYLDIGTKSQPVSVKPLCYDLETSGYFHLDPDLAEFYGQYDWESTLSVGVGGSGASAGISTTVGYSFGLGAAIRIDEEDFGIESAKVHAAVYGKLDINWELGFSPFSTSGSYEVASASLEGDLMLNFNETVTASGALSGQITILDVWSGSFDMNVSTEM